AAERPASTQERQIDEHCHHEIKQHGDPARHSWTESVVVQGLDVISMQIYSRYSPDRAQEALYRGSVSCALMPRSSDDNDSVAAAFARLRQASEQFRCRNLIE